MRASRLLSALCLLFFALMAVISAVTVCRDRADLPRVALAALVEETPGQYRVPLAAVDTDGEGRACLWCIEEREGPWGKEYHCSKIPVRTLQLSPDGETALVAGSGIGGRPVALPKGQPLRDGERVRFAEGW